MKFRFVFAAFVLSGSLCCGQQPQKPQVLFSGPPHPKTPSATELAETTKVTDAVRRAVAIIAWDLDVHLTPRDQSLEAHARVTLHNAGTEPLKLIPLQLSSSLHFETIGLQGRRLPFSTTTLNSDTDHTGQLIEAAIQPPTALAPGTTLTLDVDYGGSVPLTAQRLLAIGAPEARAQASDWDRIASDFTGMRGFGNVVWYPVSSLPAVLGDGARVFNEIGRQKLMDQNATMALRITDEFMDQPPNVAILDGEYVPLDKPTSMPTASFPGVITTSLAARRIGFDVPSLFLARRTETSGHGVRVLATNADAQYAQNYTGAAATIEPLLRSWLGSAPSSPATILELPEPDDDPAETGNVLLTPLSNQQPTHLAPALAHALAHAEFRSPRAWLNEGVASFVGNLWIDSTSGHAAAMENLNAARQALALAEPASPGQGGGQDLLHASNPVYYRTKAVYVLWMLRNLIGDKALSSALQAYRPQDDTQDNSFERLAEKFSGSDLRWFFDNWVYEDRGLPDLSIEGVYPTAEAHQQFLVATAIRNDGYAEAYVPLTLKAGDAAATNWVRVPAHGQITHRMLFQQSPTEVDLNDGSVPEVSDSVHQRIITDAPAH
ncbi:MAG TPA: hypothetical protein VJV22_03545 [Acidobacteriaceae bacterium]|nr:hypothetical protein [Acidobacteriaceae bacterium]